MTFASILNILFYLERCNKVPYNEIYAYSSFNKQADKIIMCVCMLSNICKRYY